MLRPQYHGSGPCYTTFHANQLLQPSYRTEICPQNVLGPRDWLRNSKLCGACNYSWSFKSRIYQIRSNVSETCGFAKRLCRRSQQRSLKLHFCECASWFAAPSRWINKLKINSARKVCLKRWALCRGQSLQVNVALLSPRVFVRDQVDWPLETHGGATIFILRRSDWGHSGYGWVYFNCIHQRMRFVYQRESLQASHQHVLLVWFERATENGWHCSRSLLSGLFRATEAKTNWMHRL